MQPDTRKHLIDIFDSAADIRAFTEGYDLATYRADAKTRAAVERKLEIIGEACARIRDNDPESFETLTHAPQVIGLRNRVIHGYDSVDDAIIWDVVLVSWIHFSDASSPSSIRRTQLRIA